MIPLGNSSCGCWCSSRWEILLEICWNIWVITLTLNLLFKQSVIAARYLRHSEMYAEHARIILGALKRIGMFYEYLSESRGSSFEKKYLYQLGGGDRDSLIYTEPMSYKHKYEWSCYPGLMKRIPTHFLSLQTSNLCFWLNMNEIFRSVPKQRGFVRPPSIPNTFWIKEEEQIF